MLIAICLVGVLVFHSYYYESVYVHGPSMSPTLTGGTAENEVVDFGIVDTHKAAINHIKRFDIVSTYFPEDYSSSVLSPTARKKIKRIIAMPGETFIIKDGLLSVKEGDEFVNKPYNFKVSAKTTAKDTVNPITLGENEYWVLGDNRTNSSDSAIIKSPIKKEYICGVLVAIEGQAKLKVTAKVCTNRSCKNCGKKIKNNNGNACSVCYEILEPVYGLKNKHYHWPMFF